METNLPALAKFVQLVDNGNVSVCNKNSPLSILFFYDIFFKIFSRLLALLHIIHLLKVSLPYMLRYVACCFI